MSKQWTTAHTSQGLNTKPTQTKLCDSYTGNGNKRYTGFH